MRINTTHTGKVQEALDQAQGNTRARVYTPEDVASECRELEKKLQALPSKYHKGVKAYLASWNAGSNAHPNKGTVITVERGAKDWFITSIKRHYKPATSPRIESRGPDFDSLVRHAGFIPESSYHLARI